MNTADTAETAAFDRSIPPAGRRSVLRAVAVPTEHGGWSLTLEPVLLALLVAWSWSGLALGVAAMLAFVARTPVKVVLVDGWRHRWLDRTRVAALVAAVELFTLVVLVTIAGFTGDGRFWIPFAVAAPLIAIELWFDMRSRSRRLIPELAGTVGIGSVAAAIALADGADLRLALGLWCVVAARGAAAIPYVRTQVFRLHARPHQRWPSDLAQVLAAVAVAVGLDPRRRPVCHDHRARHRRRRQHRRTPTRASATEGPRSATDDLRSRRHRRHRHRHPRRMTPTRHSNPPTPESGSRRRSW